MPHARSLSAAALWILSCGAFVGAEGAVASSHPLEHPVAAAPRARVDRRGYVREAEHARADCPKSSAERSLRARSAGRACRVRRVSPPGGARFAVQGAAATIADVLATPCQDTELTPEQENTALVRAAVLCLINRERAQSGESPLQPNPRLEQAAAAHCRELISDNYFAHVSPSGETPVDRIRTTGYIPRPSDGYVIGENLAWGTYQLSTPQAIVSAWIASAGHLANILEAQYRETGIGVTAAVPASLSGGSPGATYAQEFGVIVR